MYSPGLLDSIISLFESLERLDYPFDYLSSCSFGVRSNSGRSEKFTDYQRKVVVLNCLQVKLMLVPINCICIFIEELIDNKLMCESEPVILALVIILLTIIILLLLYLLSQKICL